MHCVCCFRWRRRVLSWTFVVLSEFVSLVSWIVPPLRRFRAATYHQQLQIRHIWRWLTSVKFRCKVDVYWFNKLFWPIKTGPIPQARKWLEICKCQQMITPHQRSRLASLATNLHRSHPDFCTFWKLCVCILRNSGVLQYSGRFQHYYRQIRTGRQVWYSHRKVFRAWSQNPSQLQGTNPLYWRLRGGSNSRCCIMQDSEPNTLLSELFQPLKGAIQVNYWQSESDAAPIAVFKCCYWKNRDQLWHLLASKSVTG